KASALNHGGKTNGFTVPSPRAQAELIEKALKKGRIDPASISYIEAHGTGTSLGDPIEVAGLSRAFGDEMPRQSCAIGSAKSNIGHLESAAGVAGMTKVLLQLRHRRLVPSLHSEQLNPNIDFEASPFHVQRELAPWHTAQNSSGKPLPRRAGISSFGAGGSNAHVIIEEYPQPPRDLHYGSPALVVLSAKNPDRLQLYAGRMADFVLNLPDNDTDQPTLHEIAYTLQVGREPMEQRLAFVTDSLEKMEQKLRQFANGEKQIVGLHQGDLKAQRTSGSSLADPLIGGEAGRSFLEALLLNRDLDRLARLWVSGIGVEWNLLAGRQPPRRVSLPNYPFAREHYWVEVTASASRRRGPVSRRHLRQPIQAARLPIPAAKAAADAGPRRSIEQALIAEVTQILKVDASRIDPAEEMGEYGFDSLSMTEFASRIGNRYKIELTPTIFFKHPTLREFAQYLAEEV
ncbi:MAG: polyketide synthase, partial [Rhodobacteraceae bacterium]|nr:polyketide synthase [Paracoccaceae bacterium]